MQCTFDLRITGLADSIATATAKDLPEPLIDSGYSGAPVVSPSCGAALAVAIIKTDGGRAANAVSLEHLPLVWPHDAPPIPWRDNAGAVLAPAAIQVIQAALEAVSIAALKDHCNRCAALGAPLSYPAGDQPAEFLRWLLEQGQLSNRRVPLYDTVERLATLSDDPELQRRLAPISARIVDHYRDIDRSRPTTAADANRPTGLEVALIPASGSARRFDLEVSLNTLGDPESQVIDPGEDRDFERLRPDDDDEVAELLDLLLERHVPSHVDPAHFTFTFRLPRRLIGTPVDRWRCSNGDPLGITFPVIVQDADRRDGDVFPFNWHGSWQALSQRFDESLCASLCWCDQDAASDPRAARAGARRARTNGAVIAWTQPPDPGTDPNDSLFGYLLKDQGVTVMLWPHQQVDPAGFRAMLEEAFAGRPLQSIADCALQLRREREDHPGSDGDAHFTLLWDPFHERRPTLFGVG
jgi:hypothetical protein